VLAWVIVKGHLPYIWKEWLSSVDHKRIGVMYIVLALVMLLRGFSDAIMNAIAAGRSPWAAPASCRPSTTTRSSRRTARS
jgi:hypothetical protein